MIQKLDSLPPF